MSSESMDAQTRTEVEAAAFRALLTHLQEHPHVQNMDLMILAEFCRNCLSKWYAKAAQERGFELSKEAAREAVYGMPYAEYKAKYQTEQPAEKREAFNKVHK